MKKLLTLLALLIGAASNAQTVGDVLTWKKGPGLGDAKLYTTPVINSLFALNGSGTFALLAQSNFANASHVHAFADLTGKPTTIGGYGITDFNSLGDARWALIDHDHLSVDITDGSTGGNGAADAGLVAKYNTEGQLKGSVGSSTTAAIYGNSTGTGYAGYFNSAGAAETLKAINGDAGSGLSGASDTGHGVDAESTNGIALHVHGVDLAGGNVALAEFAEGLTETVRLTVGNDGGLTWTSTGAQTTATNLPAFASATKGVVPASGGGTSNYLRADGSWAAPAGGGDFVGPASSTDNAILRFDGTTGKLGQNSGITIADGASGTLSGTNTGDQTSIVGITGTIAQFNTACTDADFTTGGGTATGTNTGDQTNISGNAATVTTNANLTGPVTSTGNATAIANGAISNAMLANGAVANLSGTNTGDQTTITGNAGTATALQTGRTINGTTFDGTADITVTAAAGTLTGTTLNSSVVTSSLTSVGTITSGVWTGTDVAVADGGTGSSTASGARTNLGVVQQQYASVGSGFTTTSATLADITSCGLTIAASSAVSFTGEVLFEVSSTSGGIGLGINGSTAATYVAARYEATQGAGNLAISNITAYATTTNAATVAAANTVYYGRITGRIVNGGSSSNISVQVARGGSAGTLTIRSCSLLTTGVQ